MSTVDVATSGDTPIVLPVTVTDAIQASAAYLQMTLSVLTQTQQSGLAAAASAATAQAAAAAAQTAIQNAYKRTEVLDTNYSANGYDIYIGYKTLTAARTVTLPALNSTNPPLVPGRPIIVADESNNCSSTNTITVTANGSDAFVGVSPASIQMAAGGATTMFFPSPNGWVVR